MLSFRDTSAECLPLSWNFVSRGVHFRQESIYGIMGRNWHRAMGRDLTSRLYERITRDLCKQESLHTSSETAKNSTRSMHLSQLNVSEY